MIITRNNERKLHFLSAPDDFCKVKRVGDRLKESFITMVIQKSMETSHSRNSDQKYSRFSTQRNDQ